MTEMITPKDETADQSLGWPSKRVLELLYGAQRLFGEEIAFARDEALERAQTETHLFNEFLSKVAEAHSVKDMRACMRPAASISSISFAAIANASSSMRGTPSTRPQACCAASRRTEAFALVDPRWHS